MSNELHFLTIGEASRLIEAGKLSPLEYVDALLTRIESLNPILDAFLLVTGDQARAAAKEAEAEIAAGRYRGPLHGIPFALKDIYETEGILTTAHSKILKDNADDDATSVVNLKKQGAYYLASWRRTSLHMVALRSLGHRHATPESCSVYWRVLNRFRMWSGSRLFPLVATGHGGSIRGPAGLCGIVGLKPTYGLVSRAGVIPNSYSYDHAGPMAWNVEDVAIGLQGMVSYDPLGDPARRIYRI